MISNDSDLIRELKLKKRKPINLMQTILSRELGTYTNTFGSLFSGDANKSEQIVATNIKRVYLAIHPTYTIVDVKTPMCYLRRFSPNGRYLISFSSNLNGIRIFMFKGSASALTDSYFSGDGGGGGDDQNQAHKYDRTNFESVESTSKRLKAFGTFFKELRFLRLIFNNQNEIMNKECMLFYQDTHLIVCSSETVNMDESLPPYDLMATNNESILFNVIENYTIYLIDLNEARLCDKLVFRADKINLTHNQGLGLFKNVFVVLSVQNQTIHVYNITPCNDTSNSVSGQRGKLNKQQTSTFRFVLLHQIGRFCQPDDAEIFKNPSLFIQSIIFKTPESTNASTTSATNSASTTPPKRVRLYVLPSDSTGAMTSTPSSLASTTTTGFNRQYNTRHYQSVTHSNHLRQLNNASLTPKGFNEVSYTSMKQRILTFFYRQALETESLCQFYSLFSTFENLKMYRMQLLDDQHLLIKYVNVKHLTSQDINTAAVNAAVTASLAAANMSSSAIRSLTSGAVNMNPSAIRSLAAAAAHNPHTYHASIIFSPTPAGSSTTNTTTTTATTIANNNSSNTQSDGSTSTTNNTTPSSTTSHASTSTSANSSNVVSNSFNLFTETGPIITTATAEARAAAKPLMLNETHLPFYFVVYDMKQAKIINILRNSSPQLFHAYENFQDHFSLAALDNLASDYAIPFLNDTHLSGRPSGHTLNFHSVPSNNQYARRNHQRDIKIISDVNSTHDLCKCILAQLPVSSQSHTLTPYLDHGLFSYDEKLINSFERPKPIGDQLLRFSSRETGNLLFRLYSGMITNSEIHHTRKLVTFIWHPYEPFCISIQRDYDEYYVNFHVYSKNHCV